MKRFSIETVIENGQGHYKIIDNLNGNVIHCDFAEISETLYELINV